MKEWMLYRNGVRIDSRSDSWEIQTTRDAALRYLRRAHEDGFPDCQFIIPRHPTAYYTAKLEIIEEREGEEDTRDGRYEGRKSQGGCTWSAWESGSPIEELAAHLRVTDGEGVEILHPPGTANCQWRYVPPEERRKGMGDDG